MELSFWDYTFFIAFFVIVIGVSLWKSRGDENSEDYFLAGRSLPWWLVGFSLIASNISTEHFVGMAGSGFGSLGLAVASYEWIAAITLVAVALFFLPRFLAAGIYTIPAYLEYRYNKISRSIMAFYMMIMYVAVALASVLYSGAIGLTTIFGLELSTAVWLIGILAGVYTVLGGLKAVVWTDLFQGAALIIGGFIVMVLGFNTLGEQVGGGIISGISHFIEKNSDKLHMILPADNPDIPWTALIFGIWIPNFFYWGLNQFITQRTLASKSLAEGQKGILFAASIKLIIPFIIVIPGIMAFGLYGDQITNGDQAYPTLIKNILPAGLRGIMFAALFGAVLSSLDSMLNSASTIFTMDIYKQLVNKDANPKKLLNVGRIMTGVFVLIACFIAPLLNDPKFGGIFKYIQMFQGFISPGILVVFVFGIFSTRCPPKAASIGLLMNIPIYGLLLYLMPNSSFLNHMSITFSLIAVVMAAITWANPLTEPKKLPVKNNIDLENHPAVKIWSIAIIAITIGFYIIFW